MHEHLSALAHHAYYCGELDVGRRACDRLLSLPASEQYEQLTRSNRTWYTQPLADLLTVEHSRIDVQPAREGWSTFNPTIIRHNGRLLGIVRSANYRYDAGRYVSADGDGVIRTENILVEYMSDLAVYSARVLSMPNYPKTEFPVEGLEDCRLRPTRSGLGVSATIRNAAPYDGRCRMATAEIDIEAARLHTLRVMTCGDAAPHEKNWMPILDRGGWLYSCNRDGYVVTVDPDPELVGGWQVCQRQAAPAIARAFRGGSQLIPFGKGYLACIHEVALSDAGNAESPRVYEHRFVGFDQSLAICGVSMPFVFQQPRGIEFAAGMVEHDGQVVVTYGHSDAEAWMVRMDSEDVVELLRPLPCA